jgi:hypothetical protein
MGLAVGGRETRDTNDDENDQYAIMSVELNVEIETRVETLANEPPNSLSQCDQRWS